MEIPGLVKLLQILTFTCWTELIRCVSLSLQGDHFYCLCIALEVKFHERVIPLGKFVETFPTTHGLCRQCQWTIATQNGPEGNANAYALSHMGQFNVQQIHDRGIESKLIKV